MKTSWRYSCICYFLASISRIRSKCAQLRIPNATAIDDITSIESDCMYNSGWIQTIQKQGLNEIEGS